MQRIFLTSTTQASPPTFLKEKQSNLGIEQHALVQDFTTRWNSTYYMAERILEQQALCATLLEIRKADLMPSDTEFATLEAFVTIMKPLVDVIEAIGGEEWITICSEANIEQVARFAYSSIV